MSKNLLALTIFSLNFICYFNMNANIIITPNFGIIACNGGVTYLSAGVTNNQIPVTYSLNNISYQSSNIFLNITAGNYTIYVKDSLDNVDSTSLMINEPSPLLINTVNNNINCYGNSSGFINLNVSGGIAPFSYQWSTPTIIGNIATNLIAGTYSATAKDANGCTIATSTTLTQPTSAISITNTNITNNVCFNGGTGSANVLASGGSPPLIFYWQPYGGNNAQATSLLAGTYTCTIIDANMCSITTNVSINQGNQINATISNIMQPTCFGSANGSALANANGGFGNLTYTWQPGSILNANLTTAIANLYTLTVKDANNCTTTVSLNLTQPLPLQLFAITVPPNCKDGIDGKIEIIASGNNTGVTYNWQPANLGNTNLIHGPPANYTCTATNSNGCSNSSILTIPNTNFMVNTNLSIMTNSISAVQSNASAYQWLYCDSNLAIIPNQNNAIYNVDSNGGNYAVIITDGTCIDTSECASIYPTFINNKSKLGFEIFNDFNLIKLINHTNTPQIFELYNFQLQKILVGHFTKNKMLYSSDYPAGIYFIKIHNTLTKIIL
jgi:large repetitive protein